jgi:hypothetical protein
VEVLRVDEILLEDEADDTLLVAEVNVDTPPDPEPVALTLPTYAFQFSMLLVQVSVMESPFICMTSLPFLVILTVTAPRPLNGTLPWYMPAPLGVFLQVPVWVVVPIVTLTSA